MNDGSVNQVGEGYETMHMRLQSRNTAKWCRQMTLAVHNTYYDTVTYGMDRKLSSFLVDDNHDFSKRR